MINGTVYVKDGKKAPEDYGVNREVSATINFEADNVEELQSIFDHAASMADNKVNELLGRAPPQTVTATADPEKPARKPRTPKAEAGATPSQSAEKPSTSDPLADLDDGTPAVGSPAQSGGSQESFDVDDEVDFGAEPEVVITDDQLNAAAQLANGRIKDAPRIKKLVASYNPDPTKSFQLRQIPAAQRQDFLDKLTALV